MALGVVGHTGQRGKVYIGDSRDPAATPLFVCEEFSDPSGAIFELPDDAEIEPVFPVPRRKFPDAAALTAFTEETFGMPELSPPFEFRLDVREMPAALLPFNMSQFVNRLLRAVEEGYTEAKLTLTIAEDWGYNPELLKSHLDVVYNAYLEQASSYGDEKL